MRPALLKSFGAALRNDVRCPTGFERLNILNRGEHDAFECFVAVERNVRRHHDIFPP